MTIGVTGHRDLGGEWDGRGPVHDAIRAEVAKALEDLHPETVVVGMALGADMLVAEVALDLGLRVVALLPFRGQADRWSAEQQERYRGLLDRSHVEVVSEGGAARWKYHARNRAILDRSDMLLAIYDGSSKGGTAETVKEALRRSMIVVTVDPKVVAGE